MPRRIYTFAAPTPSKPAKKLSQNAETKRQRRMARSKWGLEAAFQRADTLCRTRKSRFRKETAKATVGWDAMTKEEQNDLLKVQFAVFEQDRNTTKAAHEKEWREKLEAVREGSGNEDIILSDKEPVREAIGEDRWEDMEDWQTERDDDQDSESIAMEDIAVDAPSDEEFYDLEGNIIGEEEVMDSLGDVMDLRMRDIRQKIHECAALGRWDEDPWEDIDSDEDE
jgi:hypothetical protein